MIKNPKVISIFKTAARKDHEQVIKSMLEQKAVTMSDRSLELHKAISVGNEVVSRMILENMQLDGVKVNLDHYLCLAVRMGRDFIAEWLLELGASPSALSINGSSALGAAVRSGNLTMVQALLNTGADVRTIDRNGNSIAMLAASEKSVDVLTAVLEAGAGLDFALSSAVRSNRYTHVRLLLLRGADASEANEAGITPLIQSLLHGNRRIIKLLIQYGADPDWKNANGESALTYAARNGKYELYRLLMSLRALVSNGIQYREKSTVHSIFR